MAKTFNICKVQTSKFRAFSRQRLRDTFAKTSWRKGWDTEDATLVVNFVADLDMAKALQLNADRAKDNFERKEYQRSANDYWKSAEALEHKIWDVQTKAACEIPAKELIARDADREGRREAAKATRQQRGLARRRRKARR